MIIKKISPSSTVDYSIKQLFFEKDTFVKPKIQRNIVWTTEQKSKLIHSLLLNYYVPELCINRVSKDGVLQKEILDGLQRFSAIIQFMNNEYALHEDVDDIVVIDEETRKMSTYKIAGLKYEDFPSDLKNDFLSCKITCAEMDNLTTLEKNATFVKLNSGSALNRNSILRAYAYGQILDFVDNLSETDFFTRKISITEAYKDKMTHQIPIYQFMMHELEMKTDYDVKSIIEFVEDAKTDKIEVSEDIKNNITETISYLNKAVPEKMTLLKKVHLLPVYHVAKIAHENNIPTKQFGGFLQFFENKKNRSDKYNKACDSDKYTNIKTRLKEIEKSYKAHIDGIKEYKSQPPKPRGIAAKRRAEQQEQQAKAE